MIVLSLDIGEKGAFFCNSVDYGEDLSMKTLKELEKHVKNLVELFKPDLIIFPCPTFRMNVIKKHNRMIGVIELIAEKKEIKTYEIIDSHAKSVVLGKGVKSKEEIMDYFKVESEHLADVMMFNECFRIESDEMKRYLNEYRIIHKKLGPIKKMANWIKKNKRKKYKLKQIENIIKNL